MTAATSARWSRRRARHLAAAHDYLRAALADAAAGETLRARVAWEAASVLVALADRLHPGGGHCG